MITSKTMVQHYIIIIFMWIQLLLPEMIDSSDKIRKITLNSIQQQRIPASKLLYSMTTRSSIICVSMCLSEDQCVGCNWHEASRTCDIAWSDDGLEDSMEGYVTYSYHSKNVLDRLIFLYVPQVLSQYSICLMHYIDAIFSWGGGGGQGKGSSG